MLRKAGADVFGAESKSWSVCITLAALLQAASAIEKIEFGRIVTAVEN